VLAGGNHAWKGETIPANREDGILTAYEIAQIDLSNTELLVLSACETALGELKNANEGVVGLQRAFKLAGVKKMIMSLWEIPDKQTVELITLFYNNWLDGQTIREALHNAQMKMKQNYPPFYWAAFVVVE
jgi:CHAT domain-containing protein